MPKPGSHDPVLGRPCTQIQTHMRRTPLSHDLQRKSQRSKLKFSGPVPVEVLVSKNSSIVGWSKAFGPVCFASVMSVRLDVGGILNLLHRFSTPHQRHIDIVTQNIDCKTPPHNH